MAKHVRCGSLFTGDADRAETGWTLSYDDAGTITHVGPTEAAPPVASTDTVLDYSGLFVMPGLQDVHTHLAYGNAKTEEDIDLYQPMEFRALRGMFFAQKVLAAGYTSICAPGDAGQISLAIRNAIDWGLFDGPRVTAAAQYITTRQGLTDWYPTWIGVPDTSIGRLVTSRDEAIEEIRVMVKNGVDCIKLAMDGTQTRPDGELIAAFNQEETHVMVEEAHRLGRKVVVHAVGREATLYAARAEVDLIFHAYHLDDECIEAMLKSGSAIGPTMTLQRNVIDFTQPHEPAAIKGRQSATERLYERACVNLRKAREAGVTMMTGTDSGFAVTPYGEWHALELEIFVRDLGFTPAEALRCATSVTSQFMAKGGKIGVLEPGRYADFIAVEGSPLENIAILQDKKRIRHVHIGGRRMQVDDRGYDPRQVTDRSWSNWTELYTQEHVRTVRARRLGLAAE
ncbi:amidohydrolase family protein [Roseomonas sp. NAR14]|uniref:Amidohydrolase family protein n=1 Tax=Roseomonas acroporae TaxID=2937791 RepID=A0A9X1YBJ7_9PROT|nr:amidohydrolase family protein [Roseomonas acroporae]MCK8786700.1 amidohydrolase family protein [Roseomonas acroporae]